MPIEKFKSEKEPLESVSEKLTREEIAALGSEKVEKIFSEIREAQEKIAAGGEMGKEGQKELEKLLEKVQKLKRGE